MYEKVPAEAAIPLAASIPSITNDVDAIIIGAGLGGLLSAAQLLQCGKRIVVLERLPHSGGRFTAKPFQGVQVSTGAVHMVPFGSSGELSRMLRRLNIPHRFFDADVFGSFYVHGKQYRSRGLLGVLKFLGLRQFFWFTRIGYLMFLRPLPKNEHNLPFDLWLERHINVARNPQLVAFFERISRFALSLELSQVSTAEVVRTTKNMLRYGAPAIVQGGCGELTCQLERHILAQGGEVRLSCDVLQILHENEHVTGVRVRDKTGGEEATIHAPLVVSDIGPRATDGLLHAHRVTQAEVLKHSDAEQPLTASADDAIREAVGLKVHILSDISLIPHKGIMYCLDTRRIAGMVQPTNSDPRLAPPGKHLLISHQVIQSNNIEEERALALADLRMLFGEAFDTHCRVLTMGSYRGEWPVNRIAQGEDTLPQTALKGLYLVGDAVKPSGYLMVEGVAQSVNRFLDLLDDLDQKQAAQEASRKKTRPRNVAAPPSRLNAFLWLWKAPGNSSK
ncbi:MAG: NAD(P)/FAD-dependent oxidoreductase [Chloroflexi bacterium]|nr:NAD(P)/FAD-dependent oxidoreductase [Chloroflexota bacterium]